MSRFKDLLRQVKSEIREVSAEQARLARLREEVRHLEDIQGKLYFTRPGVRRSQTPGS